MRHLLALLALLWALPAHAVIAFDATSEGTGTTTLSWTHTPVGTPTAVLVFAFNSVSTDQISGCTYGGVAMANLQNAADSAGEPGRTEGYRLLTGIPGSAQTVTCTVSAGSTAKHGVAFTVTSSDNHTLIGGGAASCNQQGDAANPTCTITGIGASTFTWAAAGVFRGNNAEADVTPGTDFTAGPSNDFGTIISESEYDTVERVGNKTCDFVAANDDSALVCMTLYEQRWAVKSISEE